MTNSVAPKSWFTSDWHFGHHNILTLGKGRPFATTEEHDDTLIARHNSLVGHDDQVWVLGDVAMGDITTSLACCARMNGHKILVCGNHDRPAQWEHRPEKRRYWMDCYCDQGGFEGMVACSQVAGVLLTGARVTISHYPYAGEAEPERPDRFVDRRPKDDGGWLLHGHVHDRWRVNGRQINVGVDVWDFYPVAETDLVTIIDGAES
jgi:calcineurin-like phosphoesterase family protein